jgi:ATP-dependent RNA helicase DHX8/PRP22
MSDILGDLERLEKLSLVSKVCTELENHLGINDKDLAEYIIHLAEKNPTFEKFKIAIIDASGEPFPDSFVANLLRIIQRMNPAMKPQQPQPSFSDLHKLNELKGPVSGSNFDHLDVNIKKVLCPALALPNDERARLGGDDDDDDDGDDKEEEKKKKATKQGEKGVKRDRSQSGSDEDEKKEVKSEKRAEKEKREDKKSSKKDRKKSRSRSRSRSRRHRSRSRSKKRYRSKSRSRSRSNRRRSRSRSNRRSRSRSNTRKSTNQKQNFNNREVQKSGDSEPQVGEIYDGVVSSILQFGCFVQLKGR